MTPRTAADALENVFKHHLPTGELLVPAGASFVDAESPRAGRSVADALDRGRPVVLVTRDGTWRVIPAPTPAAA